MEKFHWSHGCAIALILTLCIAWLLCGVLPGAIRTLLERAF
jgi:hypothetical protein